MICMQNGGSGRCRWGDTRASEKLIIWTLRIVKRKHALWFLFSIPSFDYSTVYQLYSSSISMKFKYVLYSMLGIVCASMVTCYSLSMVCCLIF